MPISGKVKYVSTLGIRPSQSEEVGFTHPVDNPRPLTEYLSLVGKFRHLSEEQIRHLERTGERRIELLKEMGST